MSVHLITGATGYLGQALTRTLLERGDTVGIIIRGDRALAEKRAGQLFPDYASELGSRFLVFTGDVTAPGLELCPPITRLRCSGDLSFWHLAASLSFSDADKETVIKTNVDGTRNVVDFANRHASRFYHVSTAFVCGDTRTVFRENQLEVGQHFYNWYERSKYLGEKIVREECKVPFVVFRPSIIVGDASEGKAGNCTFGYYRFTSMFYLLRRRLIRALKQGPLPVKLALRALGTRYDPSRDVLYTPWLRLPYPLNSSVDLVHIEDVVSAMVAADTLEVQSKTTFHLSQHSPPSFIFLLKPLLCDLRLDGARYLGLPAPLFRFFSQGLYYFLTPFFSRKRNRHYFQSIFKYLPYISHEYRFSLENTKAYLSFIPGPITRDRLREINRRSPEDIFASVDRELYPGSGTRDESGETLGEPVLVSSLVGSFGSLDN